MCKVSSREKTQSARFRKPNCREAPLPLCIVASGVPVSLHYRKLPLHEYRRLRVDNGSLSALQTDRRWAEIKYINYIEEIILASKEPYMAAKAAALRK